MSSMCVPAHWSRVSPSAPPPAPATTHVIVYSLTDHVAEAHVLSAPPPQPNVVDKRILFDAAHALEWKAEGGSSRCERQPDGTLDFQAAGPASCVSQPALDLYGPSVTALLIRMTVSGTDRVTLAWQPRGWPWEFCWREDMQGGFFHELLIAKQDQELTYRIDTSALPNWKMSEIDALGFVVPRAARIKIKSIATTGWHDTLAGQTVGVCKYRMGSSVQRALFMPCPATIGFHMRVPAGGRFLTDVAAADPATPATFKVELQDAAGMVSTLHSSASDASWKTLDVDLGAHEGQEIELRLSVQCDSRGQLGFWGNPAVSSGAGAPAEPSQEGDLSCERPPNILLYVIDALRADHLNVYGYQHETAPNMAKFAARGVRFERCQAQETCTRPSMVSLATGVDILVHGFTCGSGTVIPAGLMTFSEVLRDAGYRTCAVSENYHTPPHDDDRHGYCHIEELNADSSLNNMTYNTVASFLERRHNEPFFLYVHTMEVHERLSPLNDASGYCPAEPWKTISRGSQPYEQQYDAAIAFADFNFQRVLDKLAALGLDANTVIILTADHGEALGERGFFGHCDPPYRDQIHVPLLMAWPRHLAPGLSFPQSVRLIDVAPTILEIARLPIPESFQSKSLIPLLAGKGSAAAYQTEPVFTFAGWGPYAYCIIQDNWKLLTFSDESVKPKLYNLDSEPAEPSLGFLEKWRITRRLSRELTRHIHAQEQIRARLDCFTPPGADQPELPLDAGQLKALGYL